MDNILEIKDLVVRYETEDGIVRAVNSVNLALERGAAVGLVGETGAGKTTLAKSILRLIQWPPGRIAGGQILYEGKDLVAMEAEEICQIRGKEISMIFQDPMTALNPVLTVGKQIAEVIEAHEKISAEEAKKKMEDMLTMVGIDPARAEDYPHQFSGGMKQRVVIAIALACNPKLLIADEPTTALDVTIQAQILKLMNDLKREHGTSILFITHDLGVIAQMADDVAVMYCGQVVEMAPAKTLFTDCEFSHPYTEGLMVSIPRLDTPAGVRLESIPGSVPHPLNLPKGCKFAPRCKYCQQRCLEEEPELVNVTEEQQVRCFYPRKEERRANLK